VGDNLLWQQFGTATIFWATFFAEVIEATIFCATIFRATIYRGAKFIHNKTKYTKRAEQLKK
jgi:hypothetical protein